jgi:hypothetical protein
MIFTASDVSSLSQSLHRWEIAEYIFEGLVIIACAGELVADLGRKCLTRVRRNRVERLSTILLVAALSMELICLVKTNELSGRLIGSLSDKATEADAKATSAIEKSTRAETKADVAEQKADEVAKEDDALTARMGSASRQLGKFEQDMLVQGPRWRLLERGEDVFIKALKPFAGQRVTVVTCGNGDPEREGLEQLLLNVFPKAGWISPGYTSWTACPNMLSGGNEIYFVASTDDSAEWAGMPAQQWAKPQCGRFNISHDAVNTLCDALYKLRIFTTAFREKPLPKEIGIQNARLFFGFGSPDGPAEMAYKDPGRIFLLIGPSAPMFANQHKIPQKSVKPK